MSGSSSSKRERERNREGEIDRARYKSSREGSRTTADSVFPERHGCRGGGSFRVFVVFAQDVNWCKYSFAFKKMAICFDGGDAVYIFYSR